MTSNYGGIESFIMNLYRNIDHNKFQFDFINMETNNKDLAYSDEIRKLGGKIFKIPGRKESILKNHNELKKILQSNHYDYVHNNILTWSYSDGISLPLKYTNSQVIVHSHNSGMNDDMKIRKILNFVNKRYNKKTNIIRLACSNEAGKWLFNNKKFKEIPNGIDTLNYQFDKKIREKYRQRFGLTNKKIFLHVGRLSHQKNHDYLLKVFNEIQKQEKNAVLLLVGDGELKHQIKDEILRLNLDNKILMLGTRHDVRNLMFMSDVFLFPSLYEGLPMVLVEAQATGLPCLIADNISDEILLTDFIKKANIKLPVTRYAGKALNMLDYNDNREEAYTLVKKAGYDVTNTISQMEKIYQK